MKSLSHREYKVMFGGMEIVWLVISVFGLFIFCDTKIGKNSDIVKS